VRSHPMVFSALLKCFTADLVSTHHHLIFSRPIRLSEAKHITGHRMHGSRSRQIRARE
jgi:hypothetical protein